MKKMWWFVRGHKKHRVLGLIMVLLSSVSGAEVTATDRALEQRIDALLTTMTLEQKVGQMVQGNIPHVTPGDVVKYHLGSILNGGGTWPAGKNSTANDWLKRADAYHLASLDTSDGGAGIPIIWGTDAVHGHNNVIGATLFPHNIGLGASNNVDLIKTIGQATAREVAVTGLDWIFAPTVAVAKDSRWGRTYESYSDDSDIVRRYSKAMVLGLQGASDVSSDTPLNMIATAKHFIGDGGTFRGVDQGDTRLDLETLMELHGAGYLSAIDAGVQTIMASFNSWNGDKVHGNKRLLTDLLKGELGFDGFVIGDWNGHGQVEGCSDDACAAAINAGVDMIMVPEKWRSFLSNTLRQVRAGVISEARINDAVRRILRVKLRSGLFDKERPSARPMAGKTSVIGADEHRLLARRAVRESLVLLKNNDGLLPIRGGRVLIGGDGADNIGKQSGGWTLTWQGTKNEEGDFPGATSLYTGLRRAIEGVGGSVELTQNDRWRRKPDVAVVIFGEEPYAESVGDMNDVVYRELVKSNTALLSRLRAENIPVIAVFLTGRPLLVNALLNQSQAFVVAWLPGSEGGGLADVLVANRKGKPRFDFTGRLPFNWPKVSVNQYSADLPVSSYLFKRGYGLSYANPSKNMPSTLIEVVRDESASMPVLIFNTTTRKPFNAFVGDSHNWGVKVSSTQTTSLLGGISVTRVDGLLQEDSRQIEWLGGEKSQFYWRADSIVDWNVMLDSDAVLVTTFKVDKHPEGRIDQRMDCGYPCSGKIDMTAFYSAVPEGQWVRAGIPLKCFASAGVDFNRITSPLVLVSSEPFTMTINDVRVTRELPSSALVACD